ncbi:MAG TPA: hypothetical protein PK447_06550 [Ignavibacteria bacterium]|nr:hypothetical protein [Ignavibacteria bacterium]
MKHLILCVFILVCTANIHSQTYHTPDTFLKYIKESFKKFSVVKLEDDVDSPVFNNLNLNTYRQVMKSGQISLDSVNINKAGQLYLDKAEKFFMNAEFNNAITFYKLAYAQDTTYTYALTYIGQCYEYETEYDSAIIYLKKSVALNHIDFIAHWVLANSYFKLHQNDSALTHITIANILDRNNPFIFEDMKLIYRKSDKDFNEWKFSPQYRIFKDKDKPDYYVASDSNWFIYGLGRALWRYDPGYMITVNVYYDPQNTYEDYECTYLLADYLKGKSKNSLKPYEDFPDLKKLLEASNKNHRDEYIMYEVVLPRLPGAVYTLSPSSINAIKDYVLKIRYND